MPISHVFNSTICFAFMSSTCFKEHVWNSTYYITYIGCLQAVKCYVCKTGLTVENNSTIDFIKTLKVIYSGQKGAHYRVLRHNAKKPNSCENGKLNGHDINFQPDDTFDLIILMAGNNYCLGCLP